MSKGNIMNRKYTSVGITLGIVLMLIISGPASAVTVGIIGLSGSHVQGTDVSFTVNITIDEPDKYVPISNLSLDISGSVNSEHFFTLDGTLIVPNNSITITPISPPTNDYGFGYGYGYDAGYGYEFFGGSKGYGYGYNDGAGGIGSSITYSYAVKFIDFPIGSYTVIANLNTGQSVHHAFSSSSASFDIVSSSSSSSGSTTTYTPPPNVESQKTKSVTLSEPTSNVILDFAMDDIMTIAIDAKDMFESISITVQKLKDKPADIAVSAPGKVHSYINIDVGKVSGEVAGADIAFKIKKKWLSQNNIAKDNVMLARFSKGVWQGLETTVLNGDDDFVHFSARTPGFSTFAIVAKESVVTEPVDKVEAPVSIEKPVSEVVDEVSAPVEEDDNGLPGFGAIVAVMGLLMIALLVRKQDKN